MVKSKYQKFFESVLLENPSLPGVGDQGSSAPNGVDEFADDGTDVTQFNVDGIKHHKDAIIQAFMKKIKVFTDKLSPELIKTSTFGALKNSVSVIAKEIDKIQVYSKASIDQVTNEAPAIIAMEIITDPAKKAAFEKLHKELQVFIDDIDELEGKFASLKAKIDDFVGDPSISGPDGAAPGSAGQSPQPAQSGAGQPQ